MTIWLQVRNNNSGKAKFARDLAEELKKAGHDCYVGEDYGHCEIAIGFSKFRKIVPGAKHILRVDGLNMLNSKESRWRNGKIMACIQQADAVIWQSAFARKLGRKLLAKPKKDWVIHNGCKRHRMEKEYCTKFPKMVLIMGKWSPLPHLFHKRWQELLKVVESCPYKEVGFWFLGVDHVGLPRLPNMLNIGYTKSHQQVVDMMHSAKCMLNISAYDACPNAVVEALVHGLPVICNSGDGTAELVNRSGRVIDTGKQHAHYIDKFRFERFKVEDWHKAIGEFTGRPRRILRNDLLVRNVAKQYLSVIKTVVGTSI